MENAYPTIDDFLYNGWGIKPIATPKPDDIRTIATFDVQTGRLNLTNYVTVKPTKIIKMGPAFIVFWNDKTKTVLKRRDGDQDDNYAAFAQAYAIKMLGSNNHVHKMVDQLLQDRTPEKIEYPPSITEALLKARDKLAKLESFMKKE